MAALTLRVPGDKSISHRSLILAALGNGKSRIRGILQSDDVKSTAHVLRTLNWDIPPLDGAEIVVEGTGPQGLFHNLMLFGQADLVKLDCGNSGTTVRLMAGVVAASGVEAVFTGDASLSKRPMRRVAAPLEAMGVPVTLPPHGGLPMTVHRAPSFRGVSWQSEVASAQVKSAVLLAGLVANVPVEVHEPSHTRDHTERMLRARGVTVLSEDTVVTLNPTGRLDPSDVEVPGDPSSAAFLLGFAALGGAGPDGVVVENVCVNPTRVGAFRVLRHMGAALSYEGTTDQGGEPVATVVAKPGSLKGVTIEAADVPSLIDELPLLACVAARAYGVMKVTGAAELRVKESDRIRTVVENLRGIGADVDELPDGFIVRGDDRPLAGTVATHGDHRIAMAFGVLAALPGNAITIDDPSCVAVSYPTFWDDLKRLA